MCGRYTLHHKTSNVAKHFGVTGTLLDIPENYNAAPGQIMPVITEDDNGRRLELMKWGLVPGWAKDPRIGYKLINARAETLFDKPVWRNLIRRRRCLIPADGFYEWQKVTEGQKLVKQPFYVHPKQTELFAFAGVWDAWHDVEGMEWKTYSIITTDANAEMSTVHDRMPVILHPDDEAAWLAPAHNDDRSFIDSLLHPYDDGGLEMYEVSSEVNATRNNDKMLIYPLNPK